MNKKLDEKISKLDPKISGKIRELFSVMDESISMLYEIATHDEKTRAYNFQFFNNVFNMEIEKTKRGQEKLSLIIIDIDFFKKINDKYGHMKADELLKKLADVLKKQIRISDVLARFGGEEFVILLPETSLEKAKKLSARLKKAIHSDNMLKRYNLTVSGGITEFKKRDNKKRIKERADKALFKAKHEGRDRFVAVR